MEIIQFSHANGFPGSTYGSLFSYLKDEYTIHYIDTLGHNPKYPVTNNWALLSRELIEAIEGKQNISQNMLSVKSVQPVIGIGHSLGASLSFFAAIQRPDLFKALILLDAPIFAFPKSQIVRFLKSIHRLYWVTPAGERTLLRRSHWPSYESALQYFRTRSLFKNFSEAALHDFVSYGTEADNKGERVLKFDPKVEAEIYRTLPHNYADYKFKLTVPTIAIIGERSDISHGLDMRFMEKSFNIRLKRTAGGHLFPFEYPEKTAQIIKESIQELDAHHHKGQR